MPHRPRPASAVLGGLLLAATAVLAGCSSSPSPTPATSSASPVSTSPTPATSPTPSPSGPTGPQADLAALAKVGVTASWTGTFSFTPSNPLTAPSTVRIYKKAADYRIDIASSNATTLFMTTPQGYVSCQLGSTSRICLLVGPLNKPIPNVFDPGLQRIITTDMSTLASAPAGVTVEASGSMASEPGLPTAQCFQVSGGTLDPGGYCLTDAGVPRLVTYPTGTLALTSLSGAPGGQVFTPPASPTPVPTN